MNGRCVLTKSDLRIDGQCVDDQFNGPVKIVFTDGGHYEGDFKDGKFNGQGIFYRKDGTRFEGEWVNHSLNGKGRAVYANGASYEGDFVNGDMEGQGVYHFADGGVYEGEWHNGIPNGRGVYHGIPNGPFGMRRDFAGTWVNGCFAQAPLTGKGVWVFANGSRWEGDLLNAKLNGHGREVYPRENESYEGNLLNGKYEGTGVYRYHDGGVYEGEWHNGIPNGRGCITATTDTISTAPG
jgi:hypothetical protein